MYNIIVEYNYEEWILQDTVIDVMRNVCFVLVGLVLKKTWVVDASLVVLLRCEEI